MAHESLVSGLLEAAVDVAQKAAGTGRRRGSVLFEEAGRCPCPAARQDTESRDIDLEAHIAHGGDAVRERYPAVDGEDMPDGGGAHPGFVEGFEPGQRNALGQRDARSIHHRADHGADAGRFELALSLCNGGFVG